jgi:hypothetical protein
VTDSYARSVYLALKVAHHLETTVEALLGSGLLCSLEGQVDATPGY